MDLFRKVLWSNSHLCYLEIGSSVHRLGGSGRSTHKHLMGTPTVQLGRIRLATMETGPSRDSQASTLARDSRRDQEEHQEKFSAVPLSGKQRSVKIQDPQHATSSVSKPSSSSSTVHGSPIYTLQTAGVLHRS